ncbi:hypothetical protein FNU76_15005 [Chitinimonas arctica]|uniref:Uncharacterized protein n=1 Tax=Chitinimonas arctica TaxID=2594795 RepID=A0A516SHD0_9NEIS|nr:hypothetical protein [Chitinimonas arctica]QDQ27557.1 hypothetical protein FNU76_15005 [Chitinimonas arctica]
MLLRDLDQLNARIAACELDIIARNFRVSADLRQLRTRLLDKMLDGARFLAIGAGTGLLVFLAGKLFAPRRPAEPATRPPGLIRRGLAICVPWLASRFLPPLLERLLPAELGLPPELRAWAGLPPEQHPGPRPSGE